MGGLASASAQCNWPVVEGWPCRYGRTRSSWLREVMLSLVKTLLRWYWTVRALMNRRLPISGFDSPLRASVAT